MAELQSLINQECEKSSMLCTLNSKLESKNKKIKDDSGDMKQLVETVENSKLRNKI